MASRPVVLVVGQGEPMEGALTEALERHGLDITRCATPDVHTHVEQIAPDMLVLIGDAAVRNGAALLRTLTIDADTSILPVVLLSNEATLEAESSAFRTGPVAILPRGLGADAVARRVAELAIEVPERSGITHGSLDERGLSKLVELVSQELKGGILSVDSETPGVQGVNVVLDTERPPATNVEEALAQLKEILPRSQHLQYEFYEAAGGRVSLLSAEQESSAADLQYLEGIRIALMDGDSERNRVLMQSLASRGAQVVVAEPHYGGLRAIRDIDPQVAIFGSSAIQGEGFDIVRRMRRDPQLQWTSLLVVRWEEIWPEHAYAPDLLKLANRIAALTKQDVALERRAEEEVRFDTRLESLGPGRMLRALARCPGSRHATFAGRQQTIEVDIGDGVILGAYATAEEGPPTQGLAALTSLWRTPSARVTIWDQDIPSIANVMMPIDEALGLAARELDADEEEEEEEEATHPRGVDDFAIAETVAPPSRSSQEFFAVDHGGRAHSTDTESASPDFEEEEPTSQWSEPDLPIATLQEHPYDSAAATAHAIAEPEYALFDYESGPMPGPRRNSEIVAKSPQFEEGPTAKVKRTAPSAVAVPIEAVAPPISRATGTTRTVSNQPTVWLLLLLLTAGVGLFVQRASQSEQEYEERASESGRLPVLASPQPTRVVIPSETASSAEPAKPDTITELENAALFENLPKSPQKASDVLVFRAIPQIERGDLVLGEALLERAWELDNENPRAMAAFAQLHIAQKHPSEAVLWAEIAVRKRPRRAGYHLLRGDALQLSGDINAAKKAWRKALRLDPRNQTARARLRSVK